MDGLISKDTEIERNGKNISNYKSYIKKEMCKDRGKDGVISEAGTG
jgi:hypothetical protein